MQKDLTPELLPLIEKMQRDLSDLLTTRHITNPLMIGIHSGGVWIANALKNSLTLNEPIGTLDISFYRDDFSQKGLHPEVKTSALPYSVDNRHVILVDDVIMSGRTIRAAMNVLFDYGRPASIILATLINLQARELPIQPDIFGKSLALSPQERVKLRGPMPLTLLIETKS